MKIVFVLNCCGDPSENLVVMDNGGMLYLNLPQKQMQKMRRVTRIFYVVVVD